MALLPNSSGTRAPGFTKRGHVRQARELGPHDMDAGAPASRSGLRRIGIRHPGDRRGRVATDEGEDPVPHAIAVGGDLAGRFALGLWRFTQSASSAMAEALRRTMGRHPHVDGSCHDRIDETLAGYSHDETSYPPGTAARSCPVTWKPCATNWRAADRSSGGRRCCQKGSGDSLEARTSPPPDNWGTEAAQWTRLPNRKPRAHTRWQRRVRGVPDENGEPGGRRQSLLLYERYRRRTRSLALEGTVGDLSPCCTGRPGKGNPPSRPEHGRLRRLLRTAAGLGGGPSKRDASAVGQPVWRHLVRQWQGGSRSVRSQPHSRSENRTDARTAPE